jgi:hypothetical protein
MKVLLARNSNNKTKLIIVHPLIQYYEAQSENLLPTAKKMCLLGTPAVISYEFLGVFPRSVQPNAGIVRVTDSVVKQTIMYIGLDII